MPPTRRKPPRASAIFALALSVTAATSPSAARAQTLVGRVLEDGSETPVAGVLVALVGPNGIHRAEVISDSLGRFRLAPPHDGRYVVEAVRLGYESTRSPLFAIKEDRAVVPFDVMMTPLPIGLEGLEVSVEREAADVLRPFGQTPATLRDRWISHEDIEKMPLPVGPMEAIRARHMPGVQLAPCRGILDCGLCLMFTAYGQNACALTVLNGMAISILDAQQINPLDLEGIAVLSPMEATTFYGTMGGNGAVLLWTRRGGRP